MLQHKSLTTACLSCWMTSCTGLTSQNTSITSWEQQYTDVCTTRPPSTSSIAAHQSQTLPANDICAIPGDITWQYGSVLSVIGPFLSQVRRSGTHYQTVSVTQRSTVTVTDNCWRWTYFGITTEYTQRSRDASWLCVILCYDRHWHWQ